MDLAVCQIQTLMDNSFREHFRNASAQEPVDALNREVGNGGWVTARCFYLAALKEAFLATGLDCSAFINDGGGMMLRSRVRLDGDKVVPIAEAPERARELPAATPAVGAVDFQDSQSLIDALVRSMEWGNDARIQEFGAQLVSQVGANVVEGQEGILRPFDELDDLDLVVRLLDPSPERVDELEDGADLTQQKMTLLTHAVAEQCFQADGENDAWAIVRIENSAGIEAFVAKTISGCSWEGIEHTFVGVLSSVEKARAALEENGYLDAEDFRRRYTSPRI